MANSKYFLFVSLLVLSSQLSKSYAGGNGVAGLPLVYDPQTKKYFIGGNAKFSLKQGEQSSLIDRIEVSVDKGPYVSYNDVILFKEEGKHSLKFRAVSSVNNWAPVQFIEVFVDLSAPTSEANFEGSKFYKNDLKTFTALNSTISLSAQDNMSGIASMEYSFDGSHFTPYTKPIVLDKTGPLTIYYKATDKVGNAELPQHKDLVVDGFPPKSTMKLVGTAKPTVINKRTYVSDSVAFEITAQDQESGVKQIWISADDQPMTPYIKPLYFLEEGPHSLKYFAEDNVGNKELEKTFAFYTVSIAPKTSITAVGKMVNTGGINYATRDLLLKLEAGDNVVGLDRIEFKTDQDVDYRPYIEPIHFDKPGYHTVSYQAVDRAGNVEPTKTFSVHLSDTAPETTIALAQPTVTRGGITYSPSPNIVTFNVSNSSVGVEKTLVSLDDEPFKPYQGPLTISSDHKTFKITYKSVDKLGNEESPRTVVYHMISATPVVDLFISNGKSNEEKVRTNYLEGSSNPAAKSAVSTKPTGVSNGASATKANTHRKPAMALPKKKEVQ